MKLGLFSINTGICADPDLAAEIAVAAESAGFDSVWTAEHVVLPDPQVPPSPSPPLVPMLDPAVALAAIATRTTTIRLATGIIILPQRNPLVLAKEFASLDVISKGRVILALHTPFDDRGRRVEDALAAMRAMWTMDTPSHDGPYWSFSGVQSRPRPVQAAMPIVMGGRGAGAMSRSVRLCDGWYGFALDVEHTKACVDDLRTAAATFDRPAALGRLEITVTPPPTPLTSSMVAEYAALGVDRLVVLPPGRADRDALLRVIDDSVRAVAAS
jgi:probable F420-dependent oxidoreductase